MRSPLLASIDRVHEGAPHRVKDKEKALLYREICMGKSPIRQLLARKLDIRPSSVSEAVQELVDDGLVRETRAPLPGRLGRPQVLLSIRPDRYAAISIYIDSRELKGVLVTLREEVIAEEVRILPPTAGNREISAAILDLLKRLPSQVPEGCELVGAGLSLLGTVNSRTHTWMNTARWPRLHDLDLSALETRVDFPVIIRRTNEVELEYFLDCNPRNRSTSALHLHWGFGIGSAVAFRGALLTSSIGRFGEIGHVPSPRASDVPCLCGSRGCLETVAALWSLMPALEARLGRVPADEKELAPLLGRAGLLSMPEIRTALAAMQDALLVLSMIFYPDLIILSGPFTENPPVFRRLTEGLRRALPDYARGAVRFAAIPGSMPGMSERGGQSTVPRRARPGAQEENMSSGTQTLVVGGGMITADLILPSLYQLQRGRIVGEITVCAESSGSLRALVENAEIRNAFPRSSFIAQPDLATPPEKRHPDLFGELIGRMPPRQLVVVAVPDQLHYTVVMRALRGNQHVLCAKPLVLAHAQAREIEAEARTRGLFVGVEYHKRFDRRSLLARRDYRQGRFGELVLGEARLIEPYSYRHSNFQNWFLSTMTDPFTYVGCHYVDLVYFITGLRPREVSVAGVRGRFPNGNEGFLWSAGRVRWENGALLSVTNGLGYPDLAAGATTRAWSCTARETGGRG